MICQKALLFSFLLSFIQVWLFFLLLLAFGKTVFQTRLAATTVLFSPTMWIPSVSAILEIIFVRREKFISLNLNGPCPKRYYLRDWLSLSKRFPVQSPTIEFAGNATEA